MSTKNGGTKRFVLALLAALALVVCVTPSVEAQTALPENIPDFSQDASRPSVQTVQSGSWSSPSTWQGGQIPTSNHVVRILQAHTVTIDDQSAVAYTVSVDGKLAFAPTVNTALYVTNLQVMAGNMGMETPGVLEVGTTANPIAANVTAVITIANNPLGGSVLDTDQFGTGITVFGKMSMHGSVRTPTFVRLAAEPRAGQSTLTLSEAVAGWQIGDRLILPDTRHMKNSEVDSGSGGRGWINKVNQWEELTVQAISPDGRTVTLGLPLLYDHLGARNLNNVLEFLPHVGNLTRNVVVRSENPGGTRGHMLANHMADVDIRYALFKDLGRTTYLPLNTTTNHIGRYPIHMHHLIGPGPTATPANGYQFTLVGNAVDGGSVETQFKWGITVHGTHYGSIKDNVVYNYNGAAIATEDGSESFNEFDHNFVMRGMGQPDEPSVQARMAMGTEGVGFWFRGPNNFIRNNVAANFQNSTTEAAYGFVFQFSNPGIGSVAIPNFKGADTMGMHGPVQATMRNGNNMPLLEFDNNEAYGAMQGGLTYWWVNSLDPEPFPSAQESVIRNFKAWHIYNKTVYVYPGQKVILDGLKIRGNGNFAGGPNGSHCCGDGVWFEDYSTKDTVIRNADIQGMEDGIQAPSSGKGTGPNLLVENSFLRNWRNINVPTPSSVNGCWMEDKLVTISNTRFEAPPGRNLSAINMVGKANGVECLARLNEVRVYAYNGNAAANFQIYHPNPAVLPRPPGGCTPATVPGITGLISPTQSSSAATCPIAAIVTPGQITSPGAGSTLTSASQLFEWSTGVGVSSYQLSVGTFVGGSDIYSGAAGTSVSALVSGLPTVGGVIWVRLSSNIDGAWQYVDTSYTADGVPLFIDLAPGTMVSAQGADARTTPSISASAGDLLLAFVASSGPEAVGQTMTVSGGGLAWTLVKRANAQFGVSEIWKATAPVDVSGLTVTSTPTLTTPSQSVVVVTFAGTGGTGASAAASGPLGGPSVSLTATKTGSFVYGVGNDWNGSVSRTLGTNQSMVHEFLNPGNDTFWVQRLNGTVPLIGTLITLNDSAPIDHIWNFAAVEIIPMQRVPPPITWSTPADIVFGTPLDAAQLNATTTVAGTFVYDPPAGTMLSAGPNQTLSVTFTPANTSTIYGPATATVALNVTKAPTFITWLNPVDIAYGTALGASQLNATASVPGSFVYSPPAGTVLSAGNNQTLSATFTPDDPNYQPVVATVSLNVTGTTPVVIWNIPAPITYGTALGAGQLNASAGVAGSFVYSPAAGTVLGAGSRTLSVTFTPTDTAYAPSTKSVPLTVLKATPVVTWPTPASIVAGTALGATQLNATVASLPGTLVYSPATGTVLPAAPAQRLTVTFTPTDTANFNVVTAAVPITVVSSAVGAAPIKVGSAIAGTFSDATGHSGQSHLVYAPNAGVWWLFTLSSAHDALGDRTVQSYVSSGPDLATATWTAKTVSPTLGNANGATSSVLAGGRSLGVAVRSIGSTDYAHVFASAAFDGQASSNGHLRAQLGATSITWGAWNNPGSPNTASEWQGPLNSGNPPSAAATHTPWGNSIGISTGGFIHHFSVTMDQEVDCAVGRSTNADLAAAWTNGFGSNVSPTGAAGTSPPWTVAVIDKTMTNECKALAFAPLASDFMLAVYTNGAVVQPNFTNLRYQKSGASGTWTNISASTGGGSGNVFSGTATINQNDWAIVPVNTSTIYAFRRKAVSTGIDAASYSAAGNTWSAFSAVPPSFGTGQAFKAGAGMFGATDGTNVWLFVINTDTANSILYTRFNGTSWTTWATVPGTETGTQTRNFISGNPTVGSGQVGLAWTQNTATANFDVVVTSFRTAAAAAPATVIVTAPADGSTVSTTVDVTATATPGSGTIAGVQFMLDGVNLGAEDTSSPYSVSWETTTAANGTHFVTAVARDTNGGTGTATTVSVTVANDLTAPTVVMTAPPNGASVSGASVSVSADAFDDIGVAGVQFLLDGAPLGTEDTSAPYIINWNASTASAGAHTLAARARDAAGRLTTSTSVSVTVTSSTPTITWPTPASIVFGTALSATQLNATASVPGTFLYSPAAGVVLSAGAGQPLSVTFTPTDTVNYTTATASVAITVLQATPTIIWPAPANIVYGTALSAAQLNASASVAGTFAYTPAAGTVLSAGAAQSLSVTFTPTDSANYTAATTLAAITVLKATPSITWSPPANIVYGTVLDATQLNASSALPGTFAYTPVAGTVLPAGVGQPLSVTFTPTDTINYTTATASVAITVTKATPAITWPAPAAISYGTVLSPTQLNASTLVPGTFVYSPAAGVLLSASAQTLSATFTPTDATSYTTATASVALTVLKAATTITWSAPANIVYGTALGATQLDASASVPGTFAYTPVAGTVLPAGATQSLSVTFTPSDANYATATATVALTVLQATPTITWPTPADIVYGTALGAAQLNATTSVPGTFVYTPAAETVLSAGAAQSLSVTFTPTDTANYTTATASVALTVLKAATTITWSAPANIVYGTALSATQLDATASVPGTFVYSPAAGTVLSAGAAQSLSVTFTPTDANYATATATVPLTVVQATPTITWAAPANIVYGTALTATQLGATSNVAGTFVYTPAAGTVLNAGAHSLSVTFTPDDVVNYTATASTVALTVLQATPAITWATPANIVYGTALSATQLSATANVAGTFVYTPAAGAVRNAATQSLSVTFTPDDAANYTTATSSVALTVLQATPTITWAAPADLVYGTALGATQLSATAIVEGTFVYTPGAGTVVDAGTRTLSVTFTPADANYGVATATAPLTVTPAAPVVALSAGHFEYDTQPHPATGTATGIGGAAVAGSFAFTYAPGGSAPPVNAGTYAVTATFASSDPNYSSGGGTATVTIDQATPDLTWPTPADVVYGTALGSTQLNALTEIPGTDVYSPPAGTVPPAGNGQVLSMTFTPADPNYRTYTATVLLNVLKATPVITWTAPAEIGVGTALSGAQLNATANVAGTFIYAPPAGTMLAAGANQTLSVTFTPGDTANYAPAAKSVTIRVRGLPSIAVSTTSVSVGATVTATVENGPANKTDWVALYPAGGSTYFDWKYLNAIQVAPPSGLADAAVPFAMPMESGTYTLKFFSGSTLLATSATITVTGPALAVSATTVTGGGIVTATVSNGPGNARDWLGVYATSGSTLFDWKYLNGSQTAPATGVSAAAVDLGMPTAPGTYAVRLYSGSVLLASAVVTVSAAAPSTVTASATTVMLGVVVTATAANGPGNARDWIGLSATSDLANYVDWKYLNGTQIAPATGVTGAAVSFTMPTTPGTYVLRFYNSGNTLLASSATITVAMPSTTLTINTTTVGPGGAVTATVVNGPGVRTDWIAVYPEGSSTYADWRYLNGTQTAPPTGMTSAVMNMPLPTTLGNYTLRLYTGSTLVATSPTVTVSTGSSITPNTTMITPGDSISATVSNGPGNPTDWVALYAGNSPTYLEWKYLNGSQVAPATGVTSATISFSIPVVQGTYTIRFFTGSTVLAVSPAITAGFGTMMSLSATSVAPGGALIATIANGPGLARDWIGVYAASGSTLLGWTYMNGSQTVPAQGVASATVTIPMPTTPGTYVLRFASGSTILATSPIVTVQ